MKNNQERIEILITNVFSPKLSQPFFSQILESIFTSCQKASTEEQRKLTNHCISAMKCLSSWIILGLPMENMRPIFPHLFAAIRSEPLFESGRFIFMCASVCTFEYTGDNTR